MPAANSRDSGDNGAPRRKEKVRREFSAGFVIFRQTDSGPRFLLLDYGKHWDYPKGHLEKGETAWDAAVRELEEETGIRRVERVGGFKEEMHYLFRSKKRGLVSKRVTFFLGRTETKKVALSDEHEGYAWMAYREALDRLTYPNARRMLRAAWSALK
jgi:8-oxo-dGTP pyrophosphatase MutT (NUDIX family)